MPSYSFSCQSSYLTAMAREGFDFNACIYDGISYLSRAQDSAVKDRTGNPLLSSFAKPSQSPSAHSLADSMFVDRIKSRVRNWKSACQDSEKKTDDALISSLRKIVSGSEVFGSRPSLSLDVCSECQVQLVMEMLHESTDLVPLLVPAKGWSSQAIRVVLTSSKEDKGIFEKELQLMEEEQNKRVHGFREEFLVFGLFSYIRCQPSYEGNWSSENNLPAAIFYLKRMFTMALDVEVPQHIEGDEVRVHGRDFLRISELFAKLCLILKIAPESPEADDVTSSSMLESYANIFNPCFISSSDPFGEDVGISTENIG